MTTIEPPTSAAPHQLDRLRAELGAGAAGRAGGRGGVVDVGPARVDVARSGPATSAFLVDTGTRRLGDEPLVAGYLSSRAEGAPRFAVLDLIAWEGNQLLIEAELAVDEAAALDRRGGLPLRLFASRPAAPLDELGQRLAGDSRLDGDLATTLLERGDGGSRSGCADLPPELGVILGSPSRCRQTLVRAVEQLVEADRSVLLVSPDPSALDSLVLAADRALGGRPAGTMLRVGPPSTRRVGGEPRLTASGVALSQRPDLLASLHELASELRGLLAAHPHPHAAGSVSPPPRAVSRTGGPAPLPEVAVDPRELAAARQARREADAAVTDAVARAAAASADHTRARQAVRALDEARTLHRQVEELVRRVEQATGDAAASASGVGRLATGGDRRGQLLVAAEVAGARLDRRDLALAALEQARARAARLPAGRAEVVAADRRVAEARAEHARAERATLAARAHQARAARRLGELTRQQSGPGPGGVPAGAGTAVVVGRLGSAPVGGTVSKGPTNPVRSAPGTGPTGDFLGRHDTGTDLGTEMGTDIGRDVAARVGALREEYRRLRRELARQGADAPRSARVVATTVDRLVADPAVYGRRYDNVLVDGAGVLPAAFTLWAATRAERALTLMAGPGERPPSAPAAGSRWLTSNLLQLVGLDSVEAVAAHPSGIVHDRPRTARAGGGPSKAARAQRP